MRALRERIEEVGRSKDAPPRIVLGDQGRAIALRFGAVHEWFQHERCQHELGQHERPLVDANWRSVAGDSLAPAAPPGKPNGPRVPNGPPPGVPSLPPRTPPKRGRADGARHWTPPLTLLAAVACEAMRSGAATRLVWIGRRVFPYPVFLARQHPSWLAASLFVDVRERDARVWAIDVALRSGVPACVIADGQGLTLAESRRLQVAAKCGKAMALLARPACEASELSAAATRWMVTPRVATRDGSRIDHAADRRVFHARDAQSALEPTAECRNVADSGTRVAWTLTLVRSKGESLGMDAGSLIAEWRDAQGLVVIPAVVASRTHRAKADAAS